MRARFSPALIAVCAILATFLTAARLPAADGPFLDLSFAAASAQAKSEGKLVFVDVWAAWCGPCKLLDKTTWTDPAVARLLGAHTVAIKINADSDPAFARDHKVEGLPTLLVLRPDGTEVTRILGYVDAEKFQERLGPTLQTGS